MALDPFGRKKLIFLRLRNVIISGWTLIVGGLLVATTALVYLFRTGIDNPDLHSGLLIGGIALGGWLFTSGVNLHNRVSQFTLSLLFDLRHNSELLKASKEVSKLAGTDNIISKETFMELLEKKDDNSIVALNAVWTFVNFFETLSLAIRLREADESILRLYYKRIITNNLYMMQNVIKYYREQSGTSLQNWIWLARHWNAKTDFLDK
jgi:hypothetical protein